MENADTLLILGSSFPYRAFYPDDATVIQIDTRPEALGAHTQIDLGLVGDIGDTLAAVKPKLKPRTDDGFLTSALAHYRNARKGPRRSRQAKAGAATRSIRNIWAKTDRRESGGTTPCSPPMSARRRSGRRAICR